MQSIPLMLLCLLCCSNFVQADWSETIRVDEMTNDTSRYVVSAKAASTRQMGFPYTNTTASLGIGNDGVDTWVYVAFSQSPNLSNTKTGDGYNSTTTRIKYDNEISMVDLTQKWGAEFIHFDLDREVISKISQSDTVLLELDWHGEGSVYFKFETESGRDMINRLLKKPVTSSAQDAIYFTSNDPKLHGASILVNFTKIGTVPFFWENPPTYGNLRVQVEDNGRRVYGKTIEYLGGRDTLSIIPYN